MQELLKDSKPEDWTVVTSQTHIWYEHKILKGIILTCEEFDAKYPSYLKSPINTTQLGIGREPPVGNDPVNHPKHYTSHPSGVECIQITEHMGFNLGNALKYIWRADEKGNAIEDLEKAAWYVNREIAKRKSNG